MSLLPRYRCPMCGSTKIAVETTKLMLIEQNGDHATLTPAVNAVDSENPQYSGNSPAACQDCARNGTRTRGTLEGFDTHLNGPLTDEECEFLAKEGIVVAWEDGELVKLNVTASQAREAMAKAKAGRPIYVKMIEHLRQHNSEQFDQFVSQPLVFEVTLRVSSDGGVICPDSLCENLQAEISKLQEANALTVSGITINEAEVTSRG
ncbi:hypothetical protein [Ferrimonas marina]|uniref:Uncharacterized protein n=1 Tax=Ferrimonas marina TaxID=299255 RepID=A0A1M5TLI3_9GAMM|nr:hypothetical protein [Ferrimonas marina]SHH51531.1 hypothetical protein SAMN02745129_2191 [Ferrimonas marina]